MATELKIVRYCSCGASMTVATTPPALAMELDRLFDASHAGTGHGPADAKQASNARRREDRRAASDGD